MQLLNPNITHSSAFAPATSANLGVGFDILGLAVAGVGDSVTLTKRRDGKIIIEKINQLIPSQQLSGSQQLSCTPSQLPLDVHKNTASFALLKMCEDLGINCGFSLEITKGIALGSGMGGSAASAVAAVVALNGFLTNPLTKTQLVAYALWGEELASGSKHADNVAPCVFGGITLIRSLDPLEIISLPYPELYCVIIHPHLEVNTKSARQILQPQVTLKSYIAQSANLAATISALFLKDVALLQRSMQDLIIEPQRAQLVPGYFAVKAAALDSGAIAATFSGSGPSMLALATTTLGAQHIAQAMTGAFKQQQIRSDSWISLINTSGAHLTQQG